MWKPLAVVAAVGSVSLHLTIMANYSGAPSSESTSEDLPPPVATKGDMLRIPVGMATEITDGTEVKVAADTYLVFPKGTRIVANTATSNLMIIDLSVPMGGADLRDAVRKAILQTSIGQKLEEKSQNRSVQMEFWSRNGSGQIVLDEISETTTSASIRIYGDNIFARS